MNREDRQKAKQDADVAAVVKAVGLELARLSGGKGVSPSLCIEIRLSRNNHTNTGSVKCHKLAKVSDLLAVQTMLGVSASKTTEKGKNATT